MFAEGHEQVSHDEAETLHFRDCVLAFHEYTLDMMGEIARRESHMSKLSQEHKSRWNPACLTKFEKMKQAVKENQNVFDRMISKHMDDEMLQGTNVIRSAPHHMSKVRLVLHQLAREWSAEGEQERKDCFGPILEQLNTFCKKGSHVLCPGAGLGRLPVEIVGSGYACQGNEFSYHMLLAGDMVLNQLNKKEEEAVQPWLDNACNVKNSKDLYRRVVIPDKTAREIMRNNPNPDLSMCAGEFVESYSQEPNSWDCVVTCFFIDTAPNVFTYIETIKAILKPGGIWINHGPLLWHWCSPEFASTPQKKLDSRYDESVELSYDELKFAITSYGFEFLNEEWHRCNYSSNMKSMLSSTYDTVLFTCRKPLEVTKNKVQS